MVMAMCYQRLKKHAVKKTLKLNRFEKLSDQMLTGQKSESTGVWAKHSPTK